MTYKCCVVPQCKSTSIKTPEKLFLPVPTDPKRRKKWLILARRDPDSIVSNSYVVMCEDHFDIEKDVANYMMYKMGLAKKLLLADKVVPSKFYCQEDRKRRLCDPGTSRAVFAKRRRLSLIKQIEEEINIETDASVLQDDNVIITTTALESEELPKLHDRETITEPIITTDKSVQVAVKVHYRSKLVQTVFPKTHMATSPFKVPRKSSFTSPFKIEPCYQLPSKSGVTNAPVKRNIFSDAKKSDSDTSCFTEAMTGAPVVPSSSSSLMYESDSTVKETKTDIEKLQCMKHTMRKIQRKPLLYVGIHQKCYFIVDLIHKHTKINIEYILMCLKKIRLNSTFSELEDDFGISLSYASKLFQKNIPLIANVLRSFIVNIDNHLVKKNLPIAFRHNYYNVSCIIDCLELDIQTPSKAIHQALTWSDYKKGNTVKYLISCTPNGLVNYISPGFGGRTSDVVVVQNCDFLEKLEPGTFILADRGFKHLEQMLQEKNIKLVRPPSVTAGTKLSKTEVRQTKIIASLRIHVERVIRRVREFHMLKQHAVINSNILGVLNDVIEIACALINLQDSLIK